MNCPFCNHSETQVKDSRPYEDGSAIRRRRQCPACGGRFTTLERTQLRDIMVIKSDARREILDRSKIQKSLGMALRKRPFDIERIDKITSSIVRQLESEGESEIPSRAIGEKIMEVLAELDAVGYVRFASVYKNFEETDDFAAFIKEKKLG